MSRTYSEMMATFDNKFARANRAECLYALSDIRTAIANWPDNTEYVREKNCERDAVLDRIAYLDRKTKCTHCHGEGYVS